MQRYTGEKILVGYDPKPAACKGGGLNHFTISLCSCSSFIHFNLPQLSSSSLRLLERQLQDQGRAHQEECEELREEVRRMREENRQQQQVLAQSLLLPQDARYDVGLQHEVTRLTSENLVGLLLLKPLISCNQYRALVREQLFLKVKVPYSGDLQ